MAAMLPIRVFKCRGCGRRTAWLRAEMPPVGDSGWFGDCDGCGRDAPADVRNAEIAESDLRYVKRFAVRLRDSRQPADVTDYT